MTWGIVAPRAPASLARLRASVWLSDRDADALTALLQSDRRALERAWCVADRAAARGYPGGQSPV